MKHLRRLGWLAIFAACSAQANEIPAVEAELVADSDASVGAYGSEPHAFRTLDGYVYFAAKTAETGEELFRSDGTPSGARLVADLNPGRASSSPYPLGSAGGRVIVMANDGTHGWQLWAIAQDGAAQRLTSGSFAGSAFVSLGNAGNRLLLRNAGNGGGGPVSTDGTVAGTTGFQAYLDERTSCTLSDAVVGLSVIGNALAVVRSDGTTAGTQVIANLGPTFSGGFAHVFEGQCWFLVQGRPDAPGGWSLVASDGTAAGTQVAGSRPDVVPRGLASLPGALYVLQAETAGTRLVRREPGGAFTNVALVPSNTSFGFEPRFERIGALLGFKAPFSAQSTLPLGYYVSDGTAAGTRLAFPALPPTGQYVPSYGTTKTALRGVLLETNMSVVYIDGTTGVQAPLPPYAIGTDGDTLGSGYLYARSGAAGSEVWRTDGTVAGTVQLHDLWPSTASGLPDGGIVATAAGNVLYMTTAGSGTQPFDPSNTVLRSDGTAAGTYRLPDGAHPAGTVKSIAPFGDGIAFNLVDNLYSKGVWYRADAALTAATPLTAPIDAWTAPVSTSSRLVFGCGTWTAPAQDLCSVDAAGGTAGLMYPSMADAFSIVPLGNVGGAALFVAGGTVWRTDGTLPGTFALAGQSGPRYSPATSTSLLFAGRRYFHLCAGTDDCGLWSTDGTLAGTTKAVAMPAGTGTPPSMVSLGTRFVFSLQAGNYYVQLWSSDGTAAGTHLLRAVQSQMLELAAVGDRAHWLVHCGTSCEPHYYVTDGTPGNMREVALPATIDPYDHLLADVGGEAAVFTCSRPSSRSGLCIVDREGDRAVLLSSVVPGFSATRPQLVGRLADGLYLALTDDAHGTELWRLRALADHLFTSGFDPVTP